MTIRPHLPTMMPKTLADQQLASRNLADQQLEPNAPIQESDEAREQFTKFVGQALFGGMLSTMRKSTGQAAYMHGGRTEEVFQKQLDQVLVEELTEASSGTISDPMYDLFMAQRGLSNHEPVEVEHELGGLKELHELSTPDELYQLHRRQ